MLLGKGAFADIAVRYAEQVARPRVPEAAIPACWQIRKSCERFLADIEGDEWTFNAAKVERVCRFAETFPYLEGPLAQKKLKLRLEPWQVWILASLFGVVDGDGYADGIYAPHDVQHSCQEGIANPSLHRPQSRTQEARKA